LESRLGKLIQPDVCTTALSKTCWDDAGTVQPAETPGQPLVKEAGTAATVLSQTVAQYAIIT